MHIKISNSEEFQELLKALASELVEANIHYKLHRDLVESIEEYNKELNQSTAFWSLTIRSHLDISMYRLCKIYDQHSQSLNLKNLLDTIKKNIGIFDIPDFKERLKDNPFVASLSKEPRKPDKKQLEADIDFVTAKTNPLVSNLINGWRNNLLAHIGSRPIVQSKNIAADYPITSEEVKELLTSGMSILNRYSHLFSASTYSTQMIGHDDYKFVLKSIKHNLDSINERDDKETKRLIDLCEKHKRPHYKIWFMLKNIIDKIYQTLTKRSSGRA
jgi:hypothetical protein